VTYYFKKSHSSSFTLLGFVINLLSCTLQLIFAVFQELISLSKCILYDFYLWRTVYPCWINIEFQNWLTFLDSNSYMQCKFLSYHESFLHDSYMELCLNEDLIKLSQMIKYYVVWVINKRTKFTRVRRTDYILGIELLQQYRNYICVYTSWNPCLKIWKQYTY
jgi:hypothetical protein